MATHCFAHAKVKKSFFNLKILDFLSDIGFIRNKSWFHSDIKISKKWWQIWENQTYFAVRTCINAFPFTNCNSWTNFFRITIFLSVPGTALLQICPIFQCHSVFWNWTWLPFFITVLGIPGRAIGHGIIQSITSRLAVLRSLNLVWSLVLLPSEVFHTWYDIQTRSNVVWLYFQVSQKLNRHFRLYNHQINLF